MQKRTKSLALSGRRGNSAAGLCSFVWAGLVHHNKAAIFTKTNRTITLTQQKTSDITDLECNEARTIIALIRWRNK